jgi:Golgi nucleoside diphosphatase
VDDYAIVIDAGSTGSRCFVFHVTVDSEDVRKLSSFSCGKADRGISSYVDTPHDLASYLAPLLLNAAKIIPFSFHLKTTVYVKATAGMRLLSPDAQHLLWNTLVHDLNRRVDIPFLIYSDNIGTIDGHSEAFFAVLASNYIAGSIDGNLQ